MRDAGLLAAGRPGVITYSRKVFIPVTRLCRDRCHYCTFATTPNRLPQFPDVPTARELAKTDNDRKLIEIIELPYATSRPFAAPPGVPKDRADALMKAFMETHKDPEYLAAAAKLNVDVSPIDGNEVRRLIEGIAKVPAAQMKQVEAIIRAN